MKCVIKPENKIGSVNFQNPYFLIRLLSFIIIIICGSSSNTLDIANIFPLWYLSLSLECFIIQIYKFWSNQIHLSFFCLMAMILEFCYFLPWGHKDIAYILFC